MTVFTAQRRVLFSDCDPAGIVFFPQYLVMHHGVVEEWFERGLGIPYAVLVGERRTGMPTVRLELDFTAISRHGDDLSWSLAIEHLGRSSLKLALRAHGGGQLRLRAHQQLVCTSLDTHRPQALPADVRQALQPFAPA